MQELQVLARQRKSFTELWLELPQSKRDEVLAVVGEIHAAGQSIRDVWKRFKLSGHSVKICDLETAIAELLDSKRAAKRRDIYLTQLKHCLTLFARGREKTAVSAITAGDVENWINGRTDAAQTKLSNLTRLSTLFEFCWRRGYVTENLIRRVERPSLELEAPQVLTPRQSARAIVWTVKHKPDFLAWLALTLFVGLRPMSEADTVKWEHIDLDNRRIKIAAAGTKTRRHRIIDLTLIPAAAEWLDLARKLDSRLPFPLSTRLRYVWRLREAIGLKTWPQDILRHTAASNLLAHHQDAGLVAHLLGNSAGTLLRRYKALIVKEDAARFFAMLPKKRWFPSPRAFQQKL